MSATAKTNWFWSDWLGDQAVRRLSPAARGVWIDCLALMATACPTGYLCDDRGNPLTEGDIARVVNATPEEVGKLLAEIQREGAASVDRTGRFYNRRMVREASIAAKRRHIGKAGGAATRLKWQELSSLPRNNAQQDAWRAESPLSLKKDRNLPSSSESDPRAKEASKEGVAEKASKEGKIPISPQLSALVQRKWGH